MCNKSHFSLLLLLILIIGCKDEILLTNQNYSSVLVVDGLISDEKGPYTVKLSFTSPVNDNSIIPVTECLVTISDNKGHSETLTEAEPGYYTTSVSGIQGTIGNSYKLTIETSDRNKYESEFQEMKEFVEIDTITAEFTRKEHLDYPFGLPGYQFYVNTKITSNHNIYFLWIIEETFQYTADYKLDAIWDGTNILIDGADTISGYENLYRCWKTQTASNIFTGKTSNLVIPQIKDKPLLFVGTDSKRLQERYSLLLKQYSVSFDAYLYWNSLEEILEQENILTTTQPYNLIGNIKNITNPDKTVFGYFTVGSVSKKRIFVNKPVDAAFYFDLCYLTYDYSEIFKPAKAPVFLILLENGLWAEVKEPCVNCTSNGGSNEKPDFWVDY